MDITRAGIRNTTATSNHSCWGCTMAKKARRTITCMGLWKAKMKKEAVENRAGI